MAIISPSLLSCDFGKMAAEAKRMEQAGADWLHIDVMDGHFVPNITIGVPVVSCLTKSMSGFADVHLMISEPLKYVEPFAKAGANLYDFHIEADGDPAEIIRAIHDNGMKASIALKPGTPAEAVFPYLDDLEMVLVMTVEPGFGGQSFMEDMMPKVQAVRKEAERRGLHDLLIQVDGGVSDKTIGLCAEAGANCFVSGSAIFKAPDAKEYIARLRTIADEKFQKDFA